MEHEQTLYSFVWDWSLDYWPVIYEITCNFLNHNFLQNSIELTSKNAEFSTNTENCINVDAMYKMQFDFSINIHGF